MRAIKLFKKILKFFILFICGATITWLTTYLPVNGFELIPVSDSRCGISGRGLPISFIDKFEDPTFERPPDCIGSPLPAMVRPAAIIKNILRWSFVLLLDTIFWATFIYFLIYFLDNFAKIIIRLMSRYEK